MLVLSVFVDSVSTLSCTFYFSQSFLHDLRKKKILTLETLLNMENTEEQPMLNFNRRISKNFVDKLYFLFIYFYFLAHCFAFVGNVHREKVFFFFFSASQ